MLNKFILSLTCLSLSILVELHAQQPRFEIGLAGGYTRNALTTDNGYRSYTRHYPLKGFLISAPMQYNFFDWFAVQLDLSYIQKNYAVRRTGFFEGIENEHTNSFFQTPLMAHFSFGGEHLRGFLNLGGYAGYWLSSSIQGSNIETFSAFRERGDDQQLFTISDQYFLINYNESNPFDSKRDRRLELGLLTGIGLEYIVSRHYKVFAETRFQYSITDLQKNYMISQIPRYNNTISVKLGVLYGFGSR